MTDYIICYVKNGLGYKWLIVRRIDRNHSHCGTYSIWSPHLSGYKTVDIGKKSPAASFYQKEREATEKWFDEN